MAITASSIIQPALGDITVLLTIGDPLLKIDDTVRFYGYGSYKIVSVSNQGPDGEYEVQLLRRDVNSPGTIPAGTPILTYSESIGHSAKQYAATTFLSFVETSYQSMTLTGNLTLATQHHAPGRSITIRLINNNSVTKTLTFPVSWKFLGVKPTSLLGSKTGVLSLTCFAGSTGDVATASDLDVIAVWSSQL